MNYPVNFLKAVKHHDDVWNSTFGCRDDFSESRNMCKNSFEACDQCLFTYEQDNKIALEYANNIACMKGDHSIDS